MVGQSKVTNTCQGKIKTKSSLVVGHQQLCVFYLGYKGWPKLCHCVLTMWVLCTCRQRARASRKPTQDGADSKTMTTPQFPWKCSFVYNHELRLEWSVWSTTRGYFFPWHCWISQHKTMTRSPRSFLEKVKDLKEGANKALLKEPTSLPFLCVLRAVEFELMQQRTV